METPAMELAHTRPLARRTLLAAAGAVGIAVAAGGCSSETPLPGPVADCGETGVDVETRPAPDGPLDLTRLPWRVAGVERHPDGLVVAPVGMAVFNKNTGQYEANPPHNTEQRLDVSGDFSLTADVQLGVGAALTLLADGQLPIVHDDFVFPRTGLHLTLKDGFLT